MIGDRIIVTKRSVRMGSLVFHSFIKKYSSPRKVVVAIAGVSGSQKSETAQVLQELLWSRNKIRSKSIHVDDYYISTWQSRNKIRKRTGVIGKEEINWNKINKVIGTFKTNNRKLYVQRIHKYLNALEYSISPNRAIDVLIVEGLYALYAKDVDFGVYIDASLEDTYKFRKERAKENPDNKFRKIVLQKEANCVYQSKIRASIVIPYEHK